ncbi:GNAT family N-acetyltransferase [Bacillaceae bacterium C204]|uniref:GNAT family N-acetyltransferase n=1 Tax=Neobacillus sp. 204 TaxID=3383351 RepID=UPI00397DFD25
MDYRIRVAICDETEPIRQILKENAVWFQSKGINQWSYLVDGGEYAEIHRAILSEETFVLDMDNKVIGTFTVSSKQSDWDREIWGESNAPSIYIHRLALGLDYKGNGLGLETLQWIEDNFADRVRYLRLDCVAHNQKLNQFYQNCGLTLIGQTGDFNKYQKLLH